MTKNHALLRVVIVVLLSSNFMHGQHAATSQPTKVSSEQEQVKHIALAALNLLHSNKLATVYRDYLSDLQKHTALTTEARFISLYSPVVAKTPGVPTERVLLVEYPLDKVPFFFGDRKGQFYYLVFLARYPTANIHEQLHLVKEKDTWKIATIVFVDTL